MANIAGLGTYLKEMIGRGANTEGTVTAYAIIVEGLSDIAE